MAGRNPFSSPKIPAEKAQDMDTTENGDNQVPPRAEVAESAVWTDAESEIGNNNAGQNLAQHVTLNPQNNPSSTYPDGIPVDNANDGNQVSNPNNFAGQVILVPTYEGTNGLQECADCDMNRIEKNKAFDDRVAKNREVVELKKLLDKAETRYLQLMDLKKEEQKDFELELKKLRTENHEATWAKTNALAETEETLRRLRRVQGLKDEADELAETIQRKLDASKQHKIDMKRFHNVDLQNANKNKNFYQKKHNSSS